MDPCTGILSKACHRIVIIVLGVSLGLATALSPAPSLALALSAGLSTRPPTPGTEAGRASTAGATFNISWQTTCATPPAEAVTALEYAAGIWGRLISSTVPIEVSACWTATLPCAGIACGETTTSLRNFNQAPLVGIFYPAALANALAGVDLSPNRKDINVWFSSGENWSFATSETSSAPGAGTDFVSVALHEIAHGLGFEGNMYESYNVGFCGDGPYGALYPCPTIYDHFIVDQSGVPLLSFQYPDPRVLGAKLKSDANFGGPNTTAQNGAAAKLYTPAIWDHGSSLSHLDPATFNGGPNALMLPDYQSGVRHPGPVTLAIMQDMGWLRADAPNVIAAGPPAVVGQTMTWNAALVWPEYASQTITYTWTATEHAAIVHAGRGVTDTATLRWTAPGLKTVMVTATGMGTSASAVYSVEASYRVYVPLVLKH